MQDINVLKLHQTFLGVTEFKFEVYLHERQSKLLVRKIKTHVSFFL